ncbi:MAG UNVERIFIED_CONTAM: hypothetical protein LVR18_15035 [Planctomycetaceae bacterium]
MIGSTPEATVFQFAFCLLLYNTLQVTRGFIAANQKRPAESISIENIFVDVTEELLTFDVLLRRGLVWLDAIPPCEDVALRLRELLKQEWSDRWIKAINKKRLRSCGSERQTSPRIGLPHFGSGPKKTLTAADVNPPVTARPRAAIAAAGTHRGRTGRLTSTARLA